MKQITFILILFLIVMTAGGSGNGLYAGEKKIQIELFGGLAQLNPEQLNARPNYDDLYASFLTVQRYGYYHSLYGESYTYTGQVTGQLNTIKNTFQLGGRLKYALSKSLSISLGYKYISKSVDSHATSENHVRTLNPDNVKFLDDFTYTWDTGPYNVLAEGHAALLGIHYTTGMHRPVFFEGYAAAGPIFANCALSMQQLRRMTNTDGFWQEASTSVQMNGKGTGVALEAGLRVNLNVGKQFLLFIEGSYALQKVSHISGDGLLQTGYRDVNSEGYTTTTVWNGTWVMIEERKQQEWGQYATQFPYSVPGDETGTLQRFTLDLSGLQLRVGIGFKL